VVSFKSRYGIKILNLSLSTDSIQTYRTDPFDYGVERAWDAGITVVVSAGNRGPGSSTISKPGDDPLVITVGAVDDRGSTDLADHEIPDFTSRGPTTADGLAKPDLVAPGVHIRSLRVPGSTIDNATVQPPGPACAAAAHRWPRRRHRRHPLHRPRIAPERPRARRDPDPRPQPHTDRHPRRDDRPAHRLGPRRLPPRLERHHLARWPTSGSIERCRRCGTSQPEPP
jgi:subtilisin family serine protease